MKIFLKLSLFPSTIYYYGDTPVFENEFPLIDTGKKPKWRPNE